MAILEELLEPGMNLVGIELELIAKVSDGDFFEKVPFEDGDLLGAREVTTRLSFGCRVHEEPPFRLC